MLGAASSSKLLCHPHDLAAFQLGSEGSGARSIGFILPPYSAPLARPHSLCFILRVLRHASRKVVDPFALFHVVLQDFRVSEKRA